MNHIPFPGRSIYSVAFLFCIALIFTACSKDDNPTNTPEKPISIDSTTTMLATITDSVIIATYTDLDSKAVALLTAIQTLAGDPTGETLEAARQAWRDTRRPWEMSEGFLFGPVESKGLDPSMDSWPVNTTDLNAVLAGTQPLTKSYIDGLEGTLKGFHTIEYLLFGTNGNKVASELTSREREYLLALTASLKGTTGALKDAWIATGDNFGAQLRDAGKEKSIYPSQKAACEELVNGMIAIADEVANGKINEPFSQQDVTLEESRFSANSKLDFQDNIRSIKNIYTGHYISTGLGISSVVKNFNAELDARFRTEVDEAIDAIGAIPGTFTTAIFNNKSDVENAQKKVRQVQETLEKEILPLMDKIQ